MYINSITHNIIYKVIIIHENIFQNEDLRYIYIDTSFGKGH